VLNATKYVHAPEAFVARTLARHTVDDAGCWLYSGSTTRDGYAQANYKAGNKQYAVYPHVLAWMKANDGLPIEQVDHTCHNPDTCIAPCPHRRCINPEHLESVTGAENLRRSGGLAGTNARKTHCPAGHEYDHAEASGGRRCSTCRTERKRAQYKRLGAVYNARRVERMRTDPEFREHRLALQRKASRKRASARRDRYQNDTEYRERIKAAARARYQASKE
jgi:hypothetical protein